MYCKPITTDNIQNDIFHDNLEVLLEQLKDIDCMLTRKEKNEILSYYGESFNLQSAVEDLICNSVKKNRTRIYLTTRVFSNFDPDLRYVESIIRFLKEITVFLRLDSATRTLFFDTIDCFYSDDIGEDPIIWFHIVSTTIIYFFIKIEAFDQYADFQYKKE